MSHGSKLPQPLHVLIVGDGTESVRTLTDYAAALPHATWATIAPDQLEAWQPPHPVSLFLVSESVIQQLESHHASDRPGLSKLAHLIFVDHSFPVLCFWDSNHEQCVHETAGPDHPRLAGSIDLADLAQSSAPDRLFQLLLTNAWRVHQLHLDLRESEARFRRLADESPIVMWICDRGARLIYTNRAWRHVTGVQQTNATLAEFVHPDDQASLHAHLFRALTRREPLAMEVRLASADQRWIWMLSQATPRFRPDGSMIGLIGTMLDIDERKRLEDELQYRAWHDPLTHLANRDYFLQRLSQRLGRHIPQEPKSCAVLYLDLDNFKYVNDTLGHDVGDLVLTQTAARIRGAIRQLDTAARLGGDEFAILLDEADEQDARLTADRILRVLAEPYLLPDRELLITPSIGIASSSTEETTAEDLLRDADTAMYRAKSHGRSRIEIFHPALRDELLARIELEAKLREALDEDLIENFYQPIIDLRTSDVVGIETFIRWRHPQRGLLTPEVFLSVAEETGLIVPLGRVMLEAACRDWAQFRDLLTTQTPVTLTCNLSSREFAEASLIGWLAELFGRYNIRASTIRLEVTERTVMDNVRSITAALFQLRALDVRLGLDSFGSGFSSLLHLQYLPIDTLEIDRSFVSQITNGPPYIEITRSIIQLARSLGMKTVAEGVETVAQTSLLRELGCHFAQGRFFAEPMRRDTLLTWLKSPQRASNSIFANTANS